MDKNYLSFATKLAIKAGEIMKSNFTLGMKKEWKSNDSPLTITDKTINEMVINAVKLSYPNHSIIAEEGSYMLNNSEYTWVCDPIDGTFPFSHGYPCFVFSLALTKDGRSILGVVYDPIMDRLFSATEGQQTLLNGKPVSVSKHSSFKNTVIDNVAWMEAEYDTTNLYKLLLKTTAHQATLMSVCYSGSLVACGEFAATIYPDKNPWDAAAIKIIVDNANGKVTDLFGNDQRYDQNIKGFIASNNLVHNQLVKLVKESLNKKY